MITPALNIERHKIQPAGTRRTKKKVSQFINNINVDLLRHLTGRTSQKLINDACIVSNNRWVEKRIAKFHLPGRVTIFIDQLQTGRSR